MRPIQITNEENEENTEAGDGGGRDRETGEQGEPTKQRRKLNSLARKGTHRTPSESPLKRGSDVFGHSDEVRMVLLRSKIIRSYEH